MRDAATVILLIAFFAALWNLESNNPRIRIRGRRRAAGRSSESARALTRPKPPWVTDEILRLKALMPTNGCRKITASFNHLYRRKRMSVGKTCVATVLKREGHRLAAIRHQIRRRRPRTMPKSLLWGLDLTYVTASPPTARSQSSGLLTTARALVSRFGSSKPKTPS